MKSSDDLVNCIQDFLVEIKGDLPSEIAMCTADSRRVMSGAVFCVVKGSSEDGTKYAKDAIGKGASLLVSAELIDLDIPQIIVRDVRKVLALLCAEFNECSADRLKVIAVTGTNGKTSTAYMVADILNSCGHLAALNGTVAGGVPGKMKRSKLTTPGPEELHEFFAESLKAGAEYAIIEASSHGLEQDRLYGLSFEVGVFTNLSSDHLDYHGTMEKYFACKEKLFTDFDLKHAIINGDDEYGSRLRGVTFGKEGDCQVDQKTIKLAGIEIKPRVIGEFSLYNAAAAALVCLKVLGEDHLSGIKVALENFPGVPGRMEIFESGEKRAIVDFAHTADALEKALKEARKSCSGKLKLVFGCGGDRDRGRRTGMGKVSDLADEVIITNDNPRTENPAQIVEDILGVKEYKAEVIYDRASAIRTAWGNLREGDLLIVAGKGHETKQIFADRVIEFSDRDFLRNLIKEEIGA